MNTMSYATFVSFIKEHLPEMLDSEYEATFNVVRKTNYITDSVIVDLKGVPKTNRVIPAVDLYKMYEDYSNGRPMDNILNCIVSLQGEAVKQQEFPYDIKEVCSSEYIRENTVPVLISQAANKDITDLYVTKPILDMYILLRVYIGEKDGQLASFILSKEMCDKAGINIDDKLFESAINNSERLLPASIASLDEIVKQFRGRVPERNALFTAYVVSNVAHVSGAAAILYRDVLKNISVAEGGVNLYILPSSVHECIVVPVDTDVPPDALRAMVVEINATQISPSEKLTDQVYFYDTNTNEISIAD